VATSHEKLILNFDSQKKESVFQIPPHGKIEKQPARKSLDQTLEVKCLSQDGHFIHVKNWCRNIPPFALAHPR
jgi:uncharacterized protein YccT (UPF0319 family)